MCNGTPSGLDVRRQEASPKRNRAPGPARGLRTLRVFTLDGTNVGEGQAEELPNG